MGWISVIFAYRAVEALGETCDLPDAAQRRLLRTAGIEPGEAVDPGRMISEERYFGLLERIAEEHPAGRHIPWRMGAAMRCDDYGAFGLAFKTAPTLRESLRRVERYGRVVTSISNFRLVDESTAIAMEIIPGRETRLGLFMTDELAIAAAVQICREVSEAGFAPVSVEFAHDDPDGDVGLAEHLGCPVEYGAQRTGMVLPDEVLDRANRLGDQGVSGFFDDHLNERLVSLIEPGDLRAQVFDAVLDALSGGVPTLAQIAGRMGMSGRTLQRRLAAEDLAFQDIVTEARRSLAGKLLTGTEFALTEVAFLTGFSDQSTFSRAFKRWNGLTPAGYRRRERIQ